MASLQFPSFVIPLLTGGVMGALTTQFATSIRGRVQPVSYKMETLPVFKKNIQGSNLITNVIISDNGSNHTFENLFIINITISNKGNKDIEDFRFAITLGEGEQIINFEQMYSDKFHNANPQCAISPKHPSSEVEMTLKPFNRKDTYNFRLYIVIPEKNTEPGEIKLSSPHSIRFKQIQTFGEVTLSAGSLALAVSPMNRYIAKMIENVK